MGTELILRALKTETGVVKIPQRPTDGYVNVTELCQTVGKEYSAWRRWGDAEDYITSAERFLRIHRDLLIESITNGPNEFRGTWTHLLVAVEIARWCSSDFAVQVNQWYIEWQAGYLLPPKPKTLEEAFRNTLEDLCNLATTNRQDHERFDQTLVGLDGRLTKLEEDAKKYLKFSDKCKSKRSGKEFSKRVSEWNKDEAIAWGRCFRCGLPFESSKDGKIKNYTTDHVIAIDNGGSNELTNSCPMHKRCNCSKWVRKEPDCRPIWFIEKQIAVQKIWDEEEMIAEEAERRRHILPLFENFN